VHFATSSTRQHWLEKFPFVGALQSTSSCSSSAPYVGDTYTIADMAILPWYGGLVRDRFYNAAEFLSVDGYKNVQRWADCLLERPGVQRGRKVFVAGVSPVKG
jgi:glutathione S-transferase